MNRKKCSLVIALIALCISFSLFSNRFISAEEMVSEAISLVSQDQTIKSGQFMVEEDEEGLQFLIAENTIAFQSVEVEIWSQSDLSDIEKIILEKDESGRFVGRLDKKWSSKAKQVFLNVTALSEDNQVFMLKNHEIRISTVVVSPSTTTSRSTSFSSSTLAQSDDTNTSVAIQNEAVRANLSVTNHNLQAGTFDVVVSQITDFSAIAKIKIPVWTETGGQDDLRWYEPTRQPNGTYKVTIDKRNHKQDTGLYHVHLYYEDRSGKTNGISATTTALSTTGKISFQQVHPSNGTFDVLISSISSPFSIQKVLVPVWTEAGGQDDLRWYEATRQANGNYKITINKRNHKNGNGAYHVHLYYQFTNGKQQGVSSSKVSLSPVKTGTITFANQNLTTGSFDVIIQNVQGSSTIKKVKVPVWTETGGQDDLRWYEAVKQTNGDYKVTVNKKNHKNGTGYYQVHLYYEYTDGKQEGIGASRIALSNQGKISINNMDTLKGSFDIVISDVQSAFPLAEVQVPVWTEAGGQDDLRWYRAQLQADGTYKATVHKSNHKNQNGLYHVHLYYAFSNGTKQGVASTKTTLQHKASGKISVGSINGQLGTFEVLVTNVQSSSPIQSVQIPVWTAANGQDDLKWYTATKQANGTYKVVISKKDHKNETGLYHAHLYFTYENGRTEGIGATSATLPGQKAAAKLHIQNKNQNTGSFDILVTDVVSPNGLSTVLIPVWSDKNGQDDIVWYEGKKQANGTYKVTVHSSHHAYDQGTYHIHLYLKESSGAMVGVAQTKTNVVWTQQTPQAKIAIENVNNTFGTFDVVVSDLFVPFGIEKIQVPVWGDKNGQNDIQWYDAYKQADGSYKVTIRAANHGYETGLYHAHLYVTSNGKRYGLGSSQTNLSFTKKTGQSFIDVSSHNGYLSVVDYQQLISQGVAGVVVKLTEATSYRNPFAESQVRNAQKAGLKVSVYHYSHFTSAKEAQAEARYFVAFAKALGLPANTVMVNDIEENKTRNNINANMKAWEAEMRLLGYTNLVHYTGASWIDVNNLGILGPIQTNQFGLNNFWVAHYPYINGMSVSQARSLNYHHHTAAWQFTSKANLLVGRSFFDLNIDYTGRFTN
ncbi:GBS Bsp-like repeat-containing protein [Streptococcus cameli]